MDDDNSSSMHSPLPEAGHDPGDPLRPELDEDEGKTPPLSAPQQDMDVTEEGTGGPAVLEDDESELSDLDDGQSDEFDPNAAHIDERPVALDESNVGMLKAHKRKREGDDAERVKKRDRKRDRPRKSRRREETADETTEDRARLRKSRESRGERPRARAPTPENDDNLTPEERRKRALDRAMDDALKNPNRRRRRQDGIDLEAANDELIENMRKRMTDAAKADAEARQNQQPAMQKLKLLPEVVSLLNRNTLRDQIVDPDINLLEAVRFFLEPLTDGSLPAYNIQKELFSALAKLPITKDVLVASGIGKVTLFYTKSSRPEPGIKRQAERLLGEWTRPILNRSDDYRKREFVQAQYDPSAQLVKTGQSASQLAAAAARERKLAAPTFQNRVRVEGGLESYSIVPRSTVSHTQVVRAPGAGGGEAFRRMKQRHLAKTGQGGSRR